MSTLAIVADIGGTNARFCTVDLAVPPSVAGLQHERKFHCADFPDMAALVRAYVQGAPLGAAVTQLCICVAGAVERDEVYMPNRGWTFSRKAVADAVGRPIHFINDFTAQTHSIATLQAGEIEWLGEPRPTGNRVFAVVGPGTGLGVGAMTERHEAIPSEGGHNSFAPQNSHQLQLLQTLWQQMPRVDIERGALSGPGLERLYWANAKLQGREAHMPAPEIAKAAKVGDPFAVAVVRDFFDILAAYASDMAMVFGAVDGVYIVGDMHVQLRVLNNVHRFREKFDDKDNYRPYCSRIPLALVTAQDTGLRGCWRFLELEQG
ncbi:MAG TPA: ROK family protein [Candidatus Acidoferrum sp.]|nr:ROK family protein [Candidatus Acidoferrum sp.]